MRLLRCVRRTGWLLLSWQIIWSSGCSKTPTISPTERSLRRLASYYGMYVTVHRGSAPTTETELRAFIAKNAPGAGIDEYFRSERDGQPYVVRYSSAARPSDVIAYESEGLNGRRFVALATTEVREMDESTFQAANSKK